jgi:hypothetical protein
LARAYEIQPSEFWAMTMPETLLEFDMRDRKQTGGKLTKSQSDELLEWMANDYGRAGSQS